MPSKVFNPFQRLPTTQEPFDRSFHFIHYAFDRRRRRRLLQLYAPSTFKEIAQLHFYIYTLVSARFIQHKNHKIDSIES